MADTPSLPADRRRILLGLGAAGGIMAGGLRQPSAATAGADIGNVTAAPPSDDTGQRHPFYGRHQAGVTTPRPAAGMVASFDVVATTPAELMQLFQRLTERAAFLTQGGVPPALDPRLPPPDSGILGPVVTPDNLTFTVSVGASLFDDRFGLAALRPTQLSRMSRFRNDALDAGLCHGDLSVQLCANTPGHHHPRAARRGEEPARPVGPALDAVGLAYRCCRPWPASRPRAPATFSAFGMARPIRTPPTRH